MKKEIYKSFRENFDKYKKLESYQKTFIIDKVLNIGEKRYKKDLTN